MPGAGTGRDGKRRPGRAQFSGSARQSPHVASQELRVAPAACDRPAPCGGTAPEGKPVGFLATDVPDLEPVQRLLALAAGKWSLPILDLLARSPARYNALLAEVGSVSPKVLTETLRRHEAAALLASQPVGRTGRSYALTERGSRVRAELASLREWAAA